MFIHESYDEADGRVYDVHEYDNLDEAIAEIESIDYETHVMCPMDGHWMDAEEAKEFCAEVRDYYSRNEPDVYSEKIQAAFKYL